jgi:hypothetical protein
MSTPGLRFANALAQAIIASASDAFSSYQSKQHSSQSGTASLRQERLRSQ